jgi:hypothetical protein
MDPGELTLDSVKPLIGTKFEVTLPDGTSTTMTLDDALPFEVHQRRRPRGGQEPRRAPFSLYFTGAPTPIVPQAIYTFRSEGVTLDGIFIVPISADEEGAEYEAVFS